MSSFFNFFRWLILLWKPSNSSWISTFKVWKRLGHLVFIQFRSSSRVKVTEHLLEDGGFDVLDLDLCHLLKCPSWAFRRWRDFHRRHVVKSSLQRWWPREHQSSHFWRRRWSQPSTQCPAVGTGGSTPDVLPPRKLKYPYGTINSDRLEHDWNMHARSWGLRLRSNSSISIFFIEKMTWPNWIG